MVEAASTVEKSRPPMSNLQDVHVAMLSVAESRGLSIVALATYQGKIATVEGIAHELAHQLEGGPNFERRIRAVDDATANDHEAATLRIEVAGLALLGVCVSLRHLWRDANWRSERPKLTGASRLLSRREQRCALAFSRIVGKQRELHSHLSEARRAKEQGHVR